MPTRRYLSAWLLGWQLMVGHAIAAPQRTWVPRITEPTIWERYGKRVGEDHILKFLLDVKTHKLYFIDTQLFRLHADFVLGVLNPTPWTTAAITAYNRNYDRTKPEFILGTITFHGQQRLWTLSFWEGDQIDAATVEATLIRVRQDFTLGTLAFRPESPAQAEVARELARRGIAIVDNDSLYRRARYVALNQGGATGHLRWVNSERELQASPPTARDIVIFAEAYPDLPPVAGVITTTFQTPLSHVNLRALAWRIPNAKLRLTRAEVAPLLGTLVRYEARADGYVLRAASPAEQAQWQAAQHAVTAPVELPPANTADPRLPMLTKLGARDVIRVGAKTANLGEIVRAKLSNVATPTGFALPFYYYVRHLRRTGLAPRLARMLGDARWLVDDEWTRQALSEFQAALREAPLEPDVLEVVWQRAVRKLGGGGLFVRSSTNAEDLPRFNGAGLYDTVPNVMGKAALGAAIKQVWASVWNYRAVRARQASGIAANATVAGVLIQRALPAEAAGVLVTANLLDPADPTGFTINAKWGLGMRVVDGRTLPEQILYDTQNQGIKLLSRADDATMLTLAPEGGIRETPAPAGRVILTESRAHALVQQVLALWPLFGRRPIDVEWLLDGERIWIVQARPFIGR